MTKQGKRKASLIKRGYFLSEVKAWSGFDFKDAPWWPELRRARTNMVRKWARDHKVDLKTIEPIDLRRSLSYQRMVRQWYDSHGWTTERKRYGKVTYKIDPFAAMRFFSDEYQKKGPEKDKYMPPWRKRQHTKRERDKAIDARFSTAPGLMVL